MWWLVLGVFLGWVMARVTTSRSRSGQPRDAAPTPESVSPASLPASAASESLPPLLRSTSPCPSGATTHPLHPESSALAPEAFPLASPPEYPQAWLKMRPEEAQGDSQSPLPPPPESVPDS